MKIILDPNSLKDYAIFVKAKGFPRFNCRGCEIEFPDEYASLLDMKLPIEKSPQKKYVPIKVAMDYQAAIARLSIRKKKFAIFAACGRGKDLMMKETARHCLDVLPRDRKVLIMEPLNCIEQSIEETAKWYGKNMVLERVRSKNLNDWLLGSGGRFGICNYDALNEETLQGRLGALLVNESSIMKDSGLWARTLIRIGAGLEYKFAYTGTPAPNDRIEYGNHAVFLDQFPNNNAFLSRYFVNKGETKERWVMKPHALGKFYREISHWCLFLNNPATYGFKDGTDPLPPIHVHIHEIHLSREQREAVYQLTGKLFILDEPGGITMRSKLSQIGKGNHNGKIIEAAKPEFIRNLVNSWKKEESTIIWCRYNGEQDQLEKIFPEAASIQGKTKQEKRWQMIKDFQERRTPIIISKPECMGYGLNLQQATRHVFSSCEDSYEDFVQCIGRSNRLGSKKSLNVHIPITEIERPQMDNVLRKAKRVQEDHEEQERIFKESGIIIWE